jgi:hypothetical protein
MCVRACAHKHHECACGCACVVLCVGSTNVHPHGGVLPCRIQTHAFVCERARAYVRACTCVPLNVRACMYHVHMHSRARKHACTHLVTAFLLACMPHACQHVHVSVPHMCTRLCSCARMFACIRHDIHASPCAQARTCAYWVYSHACARLNTRGT